MARHHRADRACRNLQSPLPLLLVVLRPFFARAAIPARPGISPVCPNPVTGAEGYEPVCAVGYYKCCATCKFSTCDGSDSMELSWAGIRECIQCRPGDFCDGCDVFTRCPVSDRPNREGPRVTRAGSTRINDCETCAVGMEASLDRSVCVKKYTDVCDIEEVQRCIRGCESPVSSRRKQLDSCEQMKCTMYCTKAHADECHNIYSSYCRFVTLDPTPTSLEYDVFDPTVATFIKSCDVDCSGAPLLHGSPHTSIALALCTSLYLAWVVGS